MSDNAIKAGSRVRINAPGWAIHGQTGTVRFDGSGVVDLDSGKVAAVDDGEMQLLAEQAPRWCILRTSGSKTLDLAESLVAAGFDAWTPSATASRLFRRGATMVKGERTGPIMPTFVFARSHHMADLADIVANPANRHPGFSIFRFQDRYPLVGEASISGLRAAEQLAADELQQERDSDAREQRRQERISNLRTEQARRKALRKVQRDFPTGAHVDVSEMPAFAGLTGVVESSDGRSALVNFGGSLSIKIEAWRLTPYDVVEVKP